MSEFNARLAAYLRSSQASTSATRAARCSTLVAGDAALLYCAGLSYDGVQPGGVGARASSESLAVLLGVIVPPVHRRLSPTGASCPATVADSYCSTR